jgi:hypothetical protein
MTRRIPPLPEPRVVIEFKGTLAPRARTEYVVDGDPHKRMIFLGPRKPVPPCSTAARS